ncbi:hypothetical protein BO94DRAFT_621312 [Aspergillus sclerotioniger CBS 115572]|uniref:Uncharacterized protein n=1 Tax=Aspergillus sclerotioniger CBS 115572 TaxID=1450535 RepID=A0A317XB93_9EURO|nr:hypothetical protein BO94DRAFT_621312 [Aspergillus sclerotioniger CBS 115572]PWY94867.1 hypothetical protein BO94DRAFT_621312 [Aspergillus sclerotioniger CBS 115572]
MSQNTNHEGVFERLFGHHPHHHQNESQDETNQGTEGQCSNQQKSTGTQPSHHGEESEMDKLKDYVHEDEELEKEGQTYGGLM